MAYRYTSPREALLHYFGGRRGPRAARQRWGPRTSTRSYVASDDSDWLLVGMILHGRVEDGGCGVEIGGLDERLVRRWAEGLDARTWTTERVERLLRAGLREAGLMRASTRIAREVDEDGRATSRLVEETR